MTKILDNPHCEDTEQVRRELEAFIAAAKTNFLSPPPESGNSPQNFRSFVAALNTPDQDGNTALMYAVKNDLRMVFDTLVILHGVPVNSYSKTNETALLWAAKYGRTYMVKTLLENKAFVHSALFPRSKVNELHIAVSIGNFAMVKLFEEYAHDLIDREDMQGITPLMTAVTEGNISITKYLLEKKANPNAAITNANNNRLYRFLTPLHLAQNNDDIKRLLTQYGAIQTMDPQRTMDLKRTMDPKSLLSLLDFLIEKTNTNYYFLPLRSTRKERFEKIRAWLEPCIQNTALQSEAMQTKVLSLIAGVCKNLSDTRVVTKNSLPELKAWVDDHCPDYQIEVIPCKNDKEFLQACEKIKQTLLNSEPYPAKLCGFFKEQARKEEKRGTMHHSALLRGAGSCGIGFSHGI